MKIILAITLGILLTACGDSGGQRTANDEDELGEETINHSQLYAKIDELPPCQESVENQLVYVIDQKKFYTCGVGARKWTEIDLKGKDGEPGEKGDTGIAGTDGVDGDGITGADGVDGVDGPKGDKGDKGEKGDTGDKGKKGDKGDTGLAGADGNINVIK